MSASLVGSEMCIRDSTHANLYTRPAMGHVRCLLIHWRSTASWVVPPTVSYTHLTLPTICSV
eukprot:13464458-Alexandrium_andersonii.AAC.1